MPSDLRAATSVVIRDRYGAWLPFSKGLMATSILATGLQTERAYALAAEVERQVVDLGRGQLDADDLVDITAACIRTRAGSTAAIRYLAWRRAKRSGRPVVVVLSGAPGVGKSTVATRLAVRLSITRVVTTDTIREVLRTVIPTSVLPELHASSYELASGERHPHAGFLRQARAVGAAACAVADRLATEDRSSILEGVHLIPGHVRSQLAGHPTEPIVVELLLTLEDEQLHRAHLHLRADAEPERGGQRHLGHFEAIRTIQEELREAAVGAGVAIHDLSDPGDLTQRIVDGVVAQLDDTQALTASGQSS